MGSDELPPELRRALRELADEDAAALIGPARERARSRAKQLIEDALVDELLSAAAGRKPPTASSANVSTPQDIPAPNAGRRRTRSRPAKGEKAADGQAWWTYCVLAADDAADLSEIEGLEPGTRVEAVCEGRLAALVSPVPLSEYDDQRLREHLEELDWLERTARRHEAVLDTALQNATIVPLRLCTLYRELDGVRQLLREQETPLTQCLARIEGCAEWGVKLFAGSQPTPVEPAPEESPPERPGATYLAQRQRERTHAEQAGEVRAKAADTVHRTIGTLARKTTTNHPQRPEIHGRDLTMVLNAAYLVERARADELEAAVGALDEEWSPLGFVVELTGPWPPYNFVSDIGGLIS